MTNIYDRKILYSKEAREKILEGVNGLADAVACTLGPKGKLVVIKHGYHDAIFTKDGVTVARNVFFPDEMKNLGAEIISSVALRTGARTGDGTTTATVLARSLLTSGEEIRQEDVETVIAEMTVTAVPVTTREDYYNVAYISANGDSGIANLIADTLQSIGKDGQMTIELSSECGLKSEIVSGMSLAKGYASPYFVTNTEKMIVELDNPAILVLENSLFTLEQIFDSLNAIAKSGKSLLIIAKEVGGDALSTLILNKVKNGVKVAAVSTQGITHDFLEDIAIVTGASLTERTFGTAKKVILHHDKTVIVEGGGDKGQIEERCNLLREAKAKARLARLTGGVAVLKVGGNTEAEASERRDRVDDALGAVLSAIEEGVVPGGGTALWHAGKKIPAGGIRTATEAPIRQIVKNAGGGEDILSNMADGFDARAMEYCNMMERGIVDPLKVVCSALRDAVSVARLVLNTECAIVEKPKEVK